MKFRFPKKLLLLPLIILFFSNNYAQTKTNQINVYFTPSPPPIYNFEISATSSFISSEFSAYAQVLKLIEKAKSKIIFVTYEYNLHNLNRAFLNALRREVAVSVFIEKDQAILPQTAYLLKQITDAGGKVHLDRSRSGIMHNKFLLIDDSVVVTGSANFTLNGFFQQYNDVVTIHNRSLAKIYHNYIYTLFGLAPKKSRYASRRDKNLDEDFGHRSHLQVAFSRAGKINFASKVPQTLIVNALQACETSVHLLTYVFTSVPILSGFKNCIKKNPRVNIHGIFDNQYANPLVTAKWKIVPFNELKRLGTKVRYDAYHTKIHHKNIILDANTVITGSYNFSKSAHSRNDENLLIIRDKNIAEIYLKRFEELWEEATLPDKISLPSVHPKLFQGKTFFGTVSTVQSGNLVEIELAPPIASPDKIKIIPRTTILVRLAGVMPPISSQDERGRIPPQEPQASIAKEALLFLVGGRAVEGKILGIHYPENKTNPPVVSALLYLADSDGWNMEQVMYSPAMDNHPPKHRRISVNEILLARGLVYPLFKITDNSIVGNSSSHFVGGEKYFKHDLFSDFSAPYSQHPHPDWKQELEHLERAFLKSYKLKLYLWGHLKLKRDPLSHLDLINKQ